MRGIDGTYAWRYVREPLDWRGKSKNGVWLKAHWPADSFLQRRDYLRDAVEWFVLTEHPQQPKQCEEARKRMMLYLEERATADEVESNL